MARVSLLLACLALGSYARRVHLSGRAQSEGRLGVSKEAVAFLEALSSKAAFNPSFASSSTQSFQKSRPRSMARTNAPFMDAVASTINSSTDGKKERKRKQSFKSSLPTAEMRPKKIWVNDNSTDYEVDEGLRALEEQVLAMAEAGKLKDSYDNDNEIVFEEPTNQYVQEQFNKPLDGELYESAEDRRKKIEDEKAFWKELEKLEEQKVKEKQEARERQLAIEESQKSKGILERIATKDRLVEFVLFFLGLEAFAGGAQEAFKIWKSPNGGDPIDVAGDFVFCVISWYFWRRRVGINDKKREAERIAELELLSKIKK